MKKAAVVFVSAMSLAVLASGCGRQCKKAREEILNPTQTVMSYLATNPSGADLANGGCTMILGQFQNVPDGANVIRRIAENRFTHTNSYCLRWEHGTRMSCDHYHYDVVKAGEEYSELNKDHRYPRPYPIYPRPYPRPYPHPIYPRPVCHPVSYTFCGQWQYDTVREPGYATAVQLSSDLDLMFAKANTTCSLAMGGNADGAYSASRDLLQYITTQVKPEADTVYSMACGR
jgi:hypothetical protein